MATAAFVLLVAVLVSRLFFLVSCPPKSILMMVYRLRLSDQLFTATATGISDGGGEDGLNGVSNGKGNQGGVGRKIGVEDDETNGRLNVVDIASSRARNNRDSPFLRLPPEIRNRIYDFCLGKSVIHISTTTCEKAERGSYSKSELHGTVKASPSPLFVKFVHVICDRSVDAERNIWGNSEDTNQPEVPSYYAYYARHSQCTEALKCGQKKRATHSLPMSLIRACRDIHREASLIPYANNTFAFGNVAELELFITRSLLAPQRAAIKTLQIYGHMAIGPSKAREAPKMLRGLQTLEVVSPVLLNEEGGPKGLSQIGNHYGPFQVSRDLETVWVNYPKDIGPSCREQLRELAHRWVHCN
ncbi:hypothetical protein KC338_g9317 [Hortaea werneckii]|uniref:DUF7730 domain-containing protein n=1 Tax=Hortaea werneckii TaxID=91943 RepID=A0A3M7E662_HORWE|nr:hypothetical protein KC338_g9317 [Hortaea werneckii]RMY72062.1 hypothetical protein D0863_04759 [Hortaea werneckii]